MSKLIVLALVAVAMQAQSQAPLVVRPVPKEERVERVDRLSELALEELFRAHGPAVGLGPIGSAWKGAPAPRIDGVSFYFGTRPHPRVAKAGARLDSGPVTYVSPADESGARRMGSCRDSALEALKILAKEAGNKGANAVVDIRSDPGNPAYNTPWAIVCKGQEVRLTGTPVVLEQASRVAAGSRPPR